MNHDETKIIKPGELLNRQIAIFNVFCNGTPDLNWIRYEQWDKLQDWVCNNLKPEFSYATGISIMDAASDISESQIANGMEREQ